MVIMFDLALKRNLFQNMLFRFLTFLVIGSSFFAPNGQNLDTNNVSDNLKIAHTVSTPTKTEIPAVATSFAGAKPTAKLASAPSSNLVFNQPITVVGGAPYCTTHDAGNGIIHCAGTGFYYAHRDRAFRNLKYAEIGNAITIDGKTYHVTSRYQESVDSIVKRNGMYGIIYSGHAISLMTCAGPNDSERLIIFAD